jgi:hypothetical protein
MLQIVENHTLEQIMIVTKTITIHNCKYNIKILNIEHIIIFYYYIFFLFYLVLFCNPYSTLIVNFNLLVVILEKLDNIMIKLNLAKIQHVNKIYIKIVIMCCYTPLHINIRIFFPCSFHL